MNRSSLWWHFVFQNAFTASQTICYILSFFFFFFSPEATSFMFILFCVWCLFHSMASRHRWTEKTFVTFHLLWMNKIRENKWRSCGLSNTATLQRQFRWQKRYERASRRVSWTLAAAAKSQQQLLGEEPQKGNDIYIYLLMILGLLLIFLPFPAHCNEKLLPLIVTYLLPHF